MKIGSTPDVAAVQATQAAGHGSKRATESHAPAAQGVEVKMSGTAQAMSAGAGDGDYDSAKVERLRQSIQDGSYQINPAAIADKLLANAQDMLNAAAARPAS